MLEILVAIIVVVSMLSIIGCAYGKQQEKHRRMQEWIREVNKSKMEK
tara:strand:- start:179 stop:319 length:141 start_codon:yes stop_codon:yes gene_type:complete